MLEVLCCIDAKMNAPLNKKQITHEKCISMHAISFHIWWVLLLVTSGLKAMEKRISLNGLSHITRQCSHVLAMMTLWHTRYVTHYITGPLSEKLAVTGWFPTQWEVMLSFDDFVVVSQIQCWIISLVSDLRRLNFHDGLSPVWWQPIIWNHPDVLSMRRLMKQSSLKFATNYINFHSEK